MFTVTSEVYHAEMASAVYEHLRDFLLTIENNHCQRVEYLPIEVMQMTCEKLLHDPLLQKRGVEAYILAEKATKDYEIESGTLIEKRNREQFGVLVAFIPQGLRLPAEDSYDIQTFKTYDLTGVLRAHARQMIESISTEGQEIVRMVLSQPAVTRLPIDTHLKYLLALRNDACGWQEAGAYLFHLRLIPDLDLKPTGLETRIDRNAHCVNELSNPDSNVLLATAALANEYGLDPDANELRKNLVAFLRDRNTVDTDGWLPTILSEELWRSKLTFDKWKFRDLTKPGEVEVHLSPLEDPQTGVLANGLKKEGSNLVASTDPKSPIHLRWTTYPKHPENLGHYLLLVVRDTDDEEAGEELVRKTVKGGRSSLKLSLKDVELAEGETCAAKIMIHAKDQAGVILATDESEPFWIEGGIEIEERVKKVNKIRNRAEAFLQASYRYRKAVAIDSEGWEEGLPRLYRIKLKSRDIYRIVINTTLYDMERKILTDPLNCGAWQADLCNRAVVEAEDLRPVEITAPGLQSFENFVSSRRRLFHRFLEKDPVGVIEVLDLREFKADILDYVTCYRAMYDELSSLLQAAKSDGKINNVLNLGYRLNRIDTVHLRVGVTDEVDEVLLLAPTHPIRMLWVLQYQQLLFGWATKLENVSEEDAAQMLSMESAEQITSLNIPPAIAVARGDIYVNSDNVDLYWSILPRGTTTDIRKAVSMVLRLLKHKGGGGEITSISPSQLADKIWRYLKHHPYVSTLRLNVINPGDGLLILNAIREVQKSGEFDQLNYNVAFYGDLRHEVMGSAFDEMMEETVLPEGSQPEVDQALLRPNKNPLFPKLTFSKHRVRESDWKNTHFREAHITVLIDRFSTKVLTRPRGTAVGSFCVHNLLAEYRADFDIKADSATWSRKVIPNQNGELTPEDTCAVGIFKSVDAFLRLGSSFYDWGNSLDKVPAIQLELSDNDKHIISQVHERSDWVFTVDRNFGIEYFDNPRSASRVSARSYLIDYSPEFLEGVGHRLIISTFWLSEIESLIKDGLKKMKIPGTGFQAAQILDVLKSISGRLALKLINNPNDAREIIGLALTRLLLEEEQALKTSVLIPVDSHIDLFMEHKRQSQDLDIRIQRSDLILARVLEGKLSLKLIEVKFRSGSTGPAEEFALKEAIVNKNSDTQKVLESKFLGTPGKEQLDREIQHKQLSNLLQFYFDRCQRHGLIASQSPEAITLQAAIHNIAEGPVSLEFEKAGFIFNLQGATKPPETYKGNQIIVVGEKKIRQLLEISEDSEFEASQPPEENVAEKQKPLSDKAKPQEVSIRAKVDQKPPGPKSGPEAISKTSQAAPDRTTQTAQATTSEVPASKLRISVGKDCDSGREIFWDPLTGIPKKLTNQHILIVGKSGAGKTQTVSAFIWELCKAGVPAVIFDFQGEYMSSSLTNADGETFLTCTKAQVLDAADGIQVNPLEVPVDPYTGHKQNYMKVVYQVATSLAKIFGLGDIQHAILRDAIGQAFLVNGFAPGDKATWSSAPPMLSQVWEILQHMEESEGGNVRNLNRRVEPLFQTGVFQESADSQSLEAILRQTSIIRLSNLATPELMVAVSRFVLQKIYSDMLARGPVGHLRVFAAVDEAHKLSYEETLTELIREARKYGVGILLASQSVKDFDRIVFDMVGTKVALQLEGDDAKIMADNLGLVSKGDRDLARELILNQPPHRALIRSNHFEPYAQVDVLPFWKKRGG